MSCCGSKSFCVQVACGGGGNPCQSTINQALAAFSAFRAGNIPQFLGFTAPGFTFTFQGSPPIPFGGTFTGAAGFAAFLALLADSIVGPFVVGPQIDVTTNSTCTRVDLVDFPVTITLRCPGSGIAGPTLTLTTLLTVTFAGGLIDSIELFQDTSQLALFYDGCAAA